MGDGIKSHHRKVEKEDRSLASLGNFITSIVFSNEESIVHHRFKNKRSAQHGFS